MHFVVVEDGIGKIESLIFPKVLEKTTEVWVEENIILMKGRLSEKDGELKLLCENGFLVDEVELEKYKDNDTTKFENQKKSFFASHNNKDSSGQRAQESDQKKELTICVGDNCDQDALGQISKVICNTQTGTCRVFIVSQDSNGRLETPYHISYDDKLIKSLRSIVGEDNVQVN